MSNIDFSSLSVFDYIVLTIVALSTLFAFFRGFIHTVLSFMAWIGSIFVAAYLFPYIKPLIAGRVSHEIVANVLTFLSIYFTSLILIVIVNYQILNLVAILRLGAIDRSLGFAFGLVRGVVLVTLIFMITTFMISLFGMRESEDENAKAKIPDWLGQSQSYDLLRLSSATMIDLVPDDFWKNAKEYTQIFSTPLQPKLWSPEMDGAVTDVMGQLPAAVRLDLLDKYHVENWSQLPADKRREASFEVVDSYRQLLSQGAISESRAIPDNVLFYLEQILRQSQPSKEDLRKLREMFEKSEYNDNRGVKRVMEDIRGKN